MLTPPGGFADEAGEKREVKVNWDPQAAGSPRRCRRCAGQPPPPRCRRARAVAGAPRFTTMSLSSAPGPGRVGGGWPALKLLLFCVWLGGRRRPGHFVAPVSRFCKRSGRSFLSRWCGVTCCTCRTRASTRRRAPVVPSTMTWTRTAACSAASCTPARRRAWWAAAPRWSPACAAPAAATACGV
jgi:hypothetical protein